MSNEESAIQSTVEVLIPCVVQEEFDPVRALPYETIPCDRVVSETTSEKFDHFHAPDTAHSGCQKKSSSLYDLLSSNPDLSILNAIVDARPALVNALSDAEASITVFFPVNAAFEKFKHEPPEDVITSVSHELLNASFSCITSQRESIPVTV